RRRRGRRGRRELPPIRGGSWTRSERAAGATGRGRPPSPRPRERSGHIAPAAASLSRESVDGGRGNLAGDGADDGSGRAAEGGTEQAGDNIDEAGDAALGLHAA